MKYTLFTKSLVLATLFFGASVGVEAQTLSLLNRVQEIPVESLALPVVSRSHNVAAYQEEEMGTGDCFDLTQLGVKNKIRCGSQDAEATIEETSTTKLTKYGWTALAWDEDANVHPRQTLMSAQAQDDWVGALSVLPQGGQYSIRISSDEYKSGDIGKSSMTAFYQKIPADRPVMSIGYAVVIENPDHDFAKTSLAAADMAQPWIRISVMDLGPAGNNGSGYLTCPKLEIRPVTNKASVTGDKWSVANVGSKSYYWQNWDTIQLDMTQYVGNWVVFIFENFDCVVSGEDNTNPKDLKYTLCPTHHRSRLYVSMDCATKELTQACAGENVNLTAPEGFSYKWYATNKPTQSLGTTQTIAVPADATVDYTCEVSDYCNKTTKLTTKVYSNTYRYERTIEYGDKYPFYGDELTEPDTYTKVVPNKKNYLGCDSIEILTLNVNVPQVITQECSGNDIILTAPVGYASYQWKNTYLEDIQGAVSRQYTVSGLQSDESARFVCHMEDAQGGVVELEAVVYSNTHTFTAVINQGETYPFFGSDLSVAQTYSHPLPGQSYLGCDSIVVLNLVVRQAEKEGCFDMTDIENGNITLSNVDFGSLGGGYEGWKTPVASPYNHPRQTLIAAQGTDALVSQLSVLPPNKQTSFRLASDAYQTNEAPKGSELAFSYVVEKDNPLIFIQYACVLEDSRHNPASQQYPLESNPWVELSLQLGGAEGEICSHNPAVASSVTGTAWKTVASDANGNRAYWKDWEYISLDLSNKVGQKVSIVLRQRDCAVESVGTSVTKCSEHHSSRLYAYLGCAPKAITQVCDNNGVTLTAPEGCLYQWYKNGTIMTGETAQTLHVAYPVSDAKDQYSCELGGIVTPTPIVLQSTVYSNTHSYEKTIGYNETYNFYGDRLSEPKTYTKVVPNVKTYLGCDSIEVLTLHVNAAVCLGTAKMKKDSICADESEMVIDLNFTQGNPSSYDLRFSDAAKAAGFKDVTGVSLSLDGEGNAEIAIDLEAANPTTDGTSWYKRPGTYQVTVVEHGECDNDPQQTLSFTLLYPSSIITQRWNDVLALNNDKYNGGYVFSRIRWFHAGEGEIQGSGSHNSYVYRTLVPDDAYWAELTRSSDGQTVCTCRKIAVHQDEATAFEDGQLVHIRRFNAPQEVEIATEISGHYYMYDALGRLIATGTFGHEYGNMTIDLSDVHSNMVIITFHGNEGTKETKKLIAF